MLKSPILTNNQKWSQIWNVLTLKYRKIKRIWIQLRELKVFMEPAVEAKISPKVDPKRPKRIKNPTPVEIELKLWQNKRNSNKFRKKRFSWWVCNKKVFSTDQKFCPKTITNFVFGIKFRKLIVICGKNQ